MSAGRGFWGYRRMYMTASGSPPLGIPAHVHHCFRKPAVGDTGACSSLLPETAVGDTGARSSLLPETRFINCRNVCLKKRAGSCGPNCERCRSCDNCESCESCKLCENSERCKSCGQADKARGSSCCPPARLLAFPQNPIPKSLKYPSPGRIKFERANIFKPSNKKGEPP